MKIKGEDVVYKIIVGSHAYGTNVEGSDQDIKGVFIQSPESVLENGYLKQVEVSKDEVYFEIGRFVELLCGGNPTMLEMVFAPEDTILHCDPIILPLLACAEMLITKQLKYSFSGYAIDQIKKAAGLGKKMNWEDDKKIRKRVLDFCFVTTRGHRNESLPARQWLIDYSIQSPIGLAALDNFRYTYSIYISDGDKYKGIVSSDTEEVNDVSLSEIPKGKSRVGILYFNKDGYSKHCKEYNSYLTWLKERNEQRYIDVEGHGQKIDGKNMLHCVRLLDVAYEIAKGEGLNVRRPNAEYLKSIRFGKVPLDQIISESMDKIEVLDQLFDKSTLPDKSDLNFFQSLTKDIRKQHRLNNYEQP